MAPKGEKSEKEGGSLKQKMEREPPKVLDGTVLPDEKPFNLMEELKNHGGIETLIPPSGSESLVRQRLDIGLEKAFNCMANVYLTAWYTYQKVSLFCNKDIVSLPGLGKICKKRSLEYLTTFNEIASFASSRGGEIKFREILPPPEDFLSDRGGMALGVMEFCLSVCKIVYEKQLHLFKAAELAGDGGAMHFINDTLICPMVFGIKQDGMYITILRRLGPGVGEYIFDQHLLSGVDPGELTGGQVQNSTVERMSRVSEPPTKRARGESGGILELLRD